MTVCQFQALGGAGAALVAHECVDGELAAWNAGRVPCESEGL